MLRVSEARLRVWIYRELMGILDNKKRGRMQEALNEKQEKGELDPIERRVWSAMRIHPNNRREQKDYIKRELKAWEKRTAP